MPSCLSDNLIGAHSLVRQTRKPSKNETWRHYHKNCFLYYFFLVLFSISRILIKGQVSWNPYLHYISDLTKIDIYLLLEISIQSGMLVTSLLKTIQSVSSFTFKYNTRGQIIMAPPSTGPSLAVTGFYSFALGFLDSAAFMSPAGLSVAIKICRKNKKKGNSVTHFDQNRT